MTAQIATLDATNNDTVLADLLADLGDDTLLETLSETGVSALTEQLVEVLDDSVGDIVAGPVDDADLSDALLNAIGDDLAIGDKMKEVYANQDGLNEPAPAAADPVVEPAVEAPKKGKGKGKGKKAKTTVPPGYGSDAEGEKQPDAAAGAAGDETPAPAADEPKAPTTPRATKVNHKPGDLLVAKLGTDAAAELLVFDINHTGEQINDAHIDFVGRMNIIKQDDPAYIADKVKDKITMLFTWLHRGGELNEVMRRTFTVLHKEGKLTSGDKGNLQIDLLAKPYSMGTARSQANQMFMALPALQLTVKEKGVMVPNPNSPLLMAINAKLGLV